MSKIKHGGGIFGINRGHPGGRKGTEWRTHPTTTQTKTNENNTLLPGMQKIN